MKNFNFDELENRLGYKFKDRLLAPAGLRA